MIKNGRDKKAALLAYILISAIIIDVMLSMSIDVEEKQLVSSWGIVIFVIITAAIYIPAHYLLSRFVNRASREIRIKSRYFRRLYKIVLFSLYVIAGIMVITISQMVFTGKYSIDLLIFATAISYTLATIIMGMFSYRFFS